MVLVKQTAFPPQIHFTGQLHLKSKIELQF